MKLGIAGRIWILDIDLADTEDFSIRYSDCIVAFQLNTSAADSVAHGWLSTLSESEGQ